MARANSEQLAPLSLSLFFCQSESVLALPPNCSERNRVLQRVNTFALSKLGRLGPEASSSRRSRRLLLVQRKNRATGAGGEREGARGGGMAAMAGSRTSSARRGPVRRARDGKGVGSFDPPPSLYPHRASNDTHSIWCDRINSLRCSSSRKKRMPIRLYVSLQTIRFDAFAPFALVAQKEDAFTSLHFERYNV